MMQNRQMVSVRLAEDTRAVLHDVVMHRGFSKTEIIEEGTRKELKRILKGDLYKHTQMGGNNGKRKG